MTSRGGSVSVKVVKLGRRELVLCDGSSSSDACRNGSDLERCADVRGLCDRRSNSGACRNGRDLDARGVRGLCDVRDDSDWSGSLKGSAMRRQRRRARLNLRQRSHALRLHRVRRHLREPTHFTAALGLVEVDQLAHVLPELT